MSKKPLTSDLRKNFKPVVVFLVSVLAAFLALPFLALDYRAGLLMALYLVPMVWCILRFPKEQRLRMLAFFVSYLGLLFVTNIPFSFLALFLLAFSFEAGFHARR